MCLRLAGLDQCLRDTFVAENGHALDRRNHFPEQLELHFGLLRVEARRAGEISAWPLQIRHNVIRHRIDNDGKNNRNTRDRLVGGTRRYGTGHGDDVHLETEQFGKEIGKSPILAFRESRFDHHVAPFDVAEVSKSLPKSIEERQRTTLRCDESNSCHCGGLLCVGQSGQEKLPNRQHGAERHMN